MKTLQNYEICERLRRAGKCPARLKCVIQTCPCVSNRLTIQGGL